MAAMPLVGLIEPGAVERILKSVSYAGANVLILFEREQETGHVLFEGGELVMARLRDLRGEEALEALRGWPSGHYSLLKREQRESDARAHVLLNSLNLRTRRVMERWLKRAGYSTSIVGYPQHALQVVSYIQPEVVLMHCPRGALGVSCPELTELLRESMHVPPAVVVIDDVHHPCPEPTPECVKIPCSVEALEGLLAQPWPETRYGVRQSSEEQTAKIYRPEQLPAEPAQLASGLGGPVAAPAAAGGELTVGDLLAVIVTLLLGSAVIWTWWWLAA